MLDIIPNQPSKFRTKNLVEINDDLRGTYNTNGQIKFKNLMLKSSLSDYSNAYLLTFSYFDKYYRMIPIDLSKRQAPEADLKVIH